MPDCGLDAGRRVRGYGLGRDRVMQGRGLATGGRDRGGARVQARPFWILLGWICWFFVFRGYGEVGDLGGELFRCLLRAALAGAEFLAADFDYGPEQLLVVGA